MPGPPPTPTRILKARGSSLVKGRAGEPQLPVERPDCPAWLNREAKAEWRRQVEALAVMGVLARADRGLLAAWCEAWAEFAALVRALARETGDWRLRNAKNAAADRLVKVAQQLGFSPAARARLRAPEATARDDDGKTRFFHSA